MKSHETFVVPESDYYIYSPSKFALDALFYPMQCGRFLYQPGYSLHRDSFDSYLLMYIREGSLHLTCEQKSFHAKAGNFIFLDCYKEHAYSTETGADCLWCHFDGITARACHTAVNTKLGTVFTLPDTKLSQGRLSSIFETFQTGATVHEPLLSKYLTDILTEFLLYTPVKGTDYRNPNMVEEIITYINEHFADNISVEELADLACLSTYHFIRTFKKETGYTPHEYIVNSRIASAKYLLKNTDLLVKDICFHCGFSCESVFCSAFKRHEKITPAQYRALS